MDVEFRIHFWNVFVTGSTIATCVRIVAQFNASKTRPLWQGWIAVPTTKRTCQSRDSIDTDRECSFASYMCLGDLLFWAIWLQCLYHVGVSRSTQHKIARKSSKLNLYYDWSKPFSISIISLSRGWYLASFWRFVTTFDFRRINRQIYIDYTRNKEWPFYKQKRSGRFLNLRFWHECYFTRRESTLSTPDLHLNRGADNEVGFLLPIPATMIRFPTFVETPTCQKRPTAKDSLREILDKFPADTSKAKRDTSPSSTNTSSSARSSLSSVSPTERSRSKETSSRQERGSVW